MITVNHQPLSVDIPAELEVYLDKFPQHLIRDDKLQSCSPFRQESHPSFAVNLENGTWIDSGATGEYRKGNFISLLAFLREEPLEDTCEYLISIYSPLKQDADDLHLDMSFLQPAEQESLKVYSTDELKQYAYRSDYLQKRGISEEVQRLFRVGYDPQHKAVAMCWCDADGQVVNIKFRSVTDKRFWYAGGQRIKEHLYGLHACTQQTVDVLTVTESEIDCMRLWSVGIPAVAFGTANVSQTQGAKLLNCGVQEIVIATDNDNAGRHCGKQLEQLLVGAVKVTYFNFVDNNAKDVSDLKNTDILYGFAHRKPLKII